MQSLKIGRGQKFTLSKTRIDGTNCVVEPLAMTALLGARQGVHCRIRQDVKRYDDPPVIGVNDKKSLLPAR